jgi:hypothetical protein
MAEPYHDPMGDINGVVAAKPANDQAFHRIAAPFSP